MIHRKQFILASIMLVVLSTTANAQRRRQLPSGKEPPHPPKIGSQAPNFELKNLKGQNVSLEELTENSPVVLLVLRGWPGYQCPICNRQVGEFLSQKSSFENAQVVMIYPGPAELLEKHAKEFQGSKSFPDNYHYLIDPDYEFTNSWGLRWEAPRETAYPSTFVINTKGEIVFGNTVISHGDRTKAATVIDVLKKETR